MAKKQTKNLTPIAAPSSRDTSLLPGASISIEERQHGDLRVRHKVSRPAALGGMLMVLFFCLMLLSMGLMVTMPAMRASGLTLLMVLVFYFTIKMLEGNYKRNVDERIIAARDLSRKQALKRAAKQREEMRAEKTK